MKLKIVNLKKFITSISILGALILLICLIFSGSVYSKAEIKYKTECIVAGDTLWNIAKEEKNGNRYYNGKDIRYIVYDIKNINNLSNENLKDGQEILIPTF